MCIRDRYTYFASVAKKEGYEQIAALFLKTADNENCLLYTSLWFSSCGARIEESEEISGSDLLKKEEELAAEGENYIVVGFSQVGSESDWRIASTESFKETFSQENGYYLIFEDAQQKQENQLKAVRNFILQEVDYIVPVSYTHLDVYKRQE